MTFRSFSLTWSPRPARFCCGVSLPSRTEDASGPRSRSSRTCRCSCEICAARPFHEMSLGSSATASAFSIASWSPSSLKRTFLCLCRLARLSCRLCLTSCSWLEATRYLFFQSSAPWPNMTSLSCIFCSSDCFLSASRGFFASDSSCWILVFCVSVVTCMRRFFFERSARRCLSSVRGSPAPTPSLFTSSRSARTWASSTSRRASFSCSSWHFCRRSSPSLGRPMPFMSLTFLICSSWLSSECTSSSSSR
mmetsp:Transcript_55857/g.164042  ORF Transcript_55857/g.164042 Transcript_55857/m.164042 type:complete len:250 (-) Transcript_55857:35-784(-)